MKRGYNASMKVAEKGPLEGIEVMNFGMYEKWIGADDLKGNKWAAHKLMIEKSGGNAEELLKFLSDAKSAFPEGIADPSKTAARRTALAGMGSAVRLATGTGIASGFTSQSTTAAITTAAASFIAILGAGQLFFNPTVLKKMRRVMDGGISDQGRWRTLLGVVSSVGATRVMQNLWQEQGIDPFPGLTPSKLEQERVGTLLKNRRADVKGRGSSDFAPFAGVLSETPANSTPIDQGGGLTIGPQDPNKPRRVLPNLNRNTQ
jgi:hypothetical protein